MWEADILERSSRHTAPEVARGRGRARVAVVIYVDECISRRAAGTPGVGHVVKVRREHDIVQAASCLEGRAGRDRWRVVDIVIIQVGCRVVVLSEQIRPMFRHWHVLWTLHRCFAASSVFAVVRAIAGACPDVALGRRHQGCSIVRILVAIAIYLLRSVR
jgi:hypothetical protein